MKFSLQHRILVGDDLKPVADLVADIEKYRGKLAGKIVLTQSARDVKLLEGIVVQRWNDALLKEAMTMPIPAPPQAAPESGEARRPSLADRTQQFFLDERVAATELIVQGDVGVLASGKVL